MLGELLIMRPEEFARLIIENHIKGNGKPDFPQTLTDVEVEKAGAFVSLRIFPVL